MISSVFGDPALDALKKGIRNTLGTFNDSPVIGTPSFHSRACVRSLVRELRFFLKKKHLKGDLSGELHRDSED